MPTMGEWIELESTDGHRFDAWLAKPAGKARGGIVVVQEIFGVNEHIRSVADGFAAEGWLAIAPAVLDRAEKKVELGYDEAGVARGRDLVAKVGFDNALRDVDAAARHVARAGKVGVVGFCWGGTVALLANTRMKMPAVSYYGGRSMPFLHEKSVAPLMMHFGRRDPIIPPEHVAKLRAAFPRAEAHEYEAGHGFNCDQRGDFDAGAARIARGRTLAFFEQHLE
jgi:carboxymethylenebutenolidase